MPIRIALTLVIVGLFAVGLLNHGLSFMLQTGTWASGRTDLYWIVYLVVCVAALLVSAFRPKLWRYTLPVLIPATFSIAVKAQFFLWVAGRTALAGDVLAGTLLLHTLVLLILLLFWRWGFSITKITALGLIIYLGLLPTSEQLASMARIGDPNIDVTGAIEN